GDWKIALNAVLEIGGGMAHWIVGPRRDVPLLTGLMIPARDESAVRTRVHDVRALGAGRDPSAFASSHFVPVCPVDHRIGCSTRDSHGAVVLLRAVDVVRKITIQCDAIKLRGGLVLRAPGLSTVERDVGPSVVRVDHSKRIVWSEP